MARPGGNPAQFLLRASIADREVAKAAAQHKSHFFIEKDAAGSTIDYFQAVAGNLRIVPEGPAREALVADYELMRGDALFTGDALPFDDLMQACAGVERAANAAA